MTMPMRTEPKPVSARPKILIVEDEGLIARDIEGRVRRAGYDVAGICDSGEEAIEKVIETSPDLILMDIRLRGSIDGIETARRIQQDHDIPVIYLTAHSDRETLERAKNTGPFGYLTKPLSNTSLPTSIDLALYKHQVERELRQQRAWLRTTMQTMADAVIVTDQLGRIHYLNPAAERLTGWTTSEAMQRSLSQVLMLHHPQFGPWLDDPVAACLLDGLERPLPQGLKLVGRNRERFAIEGEIAPSTEDGTAMGAVITLRDVTVREQEEQERRHEQKMEAVGRLAAGVAHDFNNLLTVILGHASLLLQRPSGLNASATESIKAIEQAGTTASTLTRQLLTFSRNQTTEPRLVNLNTLIEGNDQTFKHLLGQDVRWVTNLDPHLYPVYGDPRHLAQVIINLVVNARDAMPGGGTITVSTTNVRAEDFAELGGDVEDHVVLSVTDTGIGMDSTVAEHIFEPFFTTKAAGHGTGLGLSIAYNLINNLGGVIAVDSTPGAGTTFRVLLPIAEQAAREQPAFIQEQQSKVDRQRTLLLVDDNDAVRGVVRTYLEGRGYNILQANDGQQALAFANTYEGEIDLLVTDVIMPKMNGLRLAEQLIRLRPNIKTLFISGYAADVIDEKSPILANSRFLQKPFLHSDLLEQVEDLLKGNLSHYHSRQPDSVQ